MSPRISSHKILILISFCLGLIGVVFPRLAHAAYPLGTETVFYHFEDAATATSTNSGSGGSTYNGTFVGNASTSAAIKRFGQRSASFGETGDYMRTYFASGTNPTTQSISASMWVYKKEASAGCNTGDDDHFFGSSGQPTGSRFYLRCTGGFWGSRFGAAAAANSVTTGITHQGWDHIVLVFDAANDRPKLYVNNVLRATSATVASYTITNAFFIGGVNDTITTPGVLTAAEGSNAYIDEVAIYNSALSVGDIAALYKAGDLIAPVISSIATSSVTSTGATISWTTDENASTQIEYGLTSTYTASSTLADDVTFVTSHSQTLSGLTPNTTYHYRVISKDPTGTTATSTDQVFTTAALPDTTAPTISSVASTTTATTATITWNTTENASSTVQYGTSISYGTASTTGGVVSSPATIVLSGLTQATTYHFKITSDDASGNSSSTVDYVFTTAADAPGQLTGLAATPYENKVYLAWTPATGTVTDYLIEYKLAADSTWTTFSDGVSTVATTTVTGLTNGSSYNFRVTALNGVTPGTVSSSVTSTPAYRVAFINPTPAGSSTINSSSFTAYASSSIPTAIATTSTHTLRLETSLGSLVSQVSTTTRYGDYNLTHLNNTLSSSDLSLVDNSSGIAYVPTTGTLFVVHNRATGSDSTIDEVSTTGALIRTITCTTCGDIEGITLISSVASTTAGGFDHTFMISSENDTANAEIYRVVIYSSGTTAVNKNDYFDTGITHSANGGLEGIAYNPTNGKFYVARELTTPALYEVTLPGSGRTTTTSQICTNLTWNAGISDFSDLTYANGILYVLSENTNPSKLVAIDVSNTSSCAYVDSDGDGDVSSSDTGDWLTSIPVGVTDQAEGVTWDATGDTLYVLGEADFLAKYRTNVFSTRHTFSGLSSGSYVLKSWFTDANGVTSYAADRAFTINLDTTAPLISNVGTTSLATSTATIGWDTNEGATSLVEYGLSSTYTASSTLDSSYVTSHTRSLTGLSPATTYHYRVVSVDSAGNIATSTNQTFTTSAVADTTAPTISSVASTTTATTATITWNTTENASSTVSYGTTASYGSASTTAGIALASPHTIVITGLSESTAYHFKITSDDASGNSSSTVDYVFTTADATAPLISNVGTTSLATSTATINWTTNENSNRKVFYGTASATYSNASTSATLATNHNIYLVGLTPDTTYYYVAVSADATGNQATSSEKTFTTAAIPDTTNPSVSISSPANGSTTASTITVVATASDNVAVTGVTFYIGTSTIGVEDTASPFSVSLDTTAYSNGAYNLVAVARDAAGNQATSSAVSITISNLDVTAPSISSVTTTSNSSTSVSVTWSTEGEDSSSRVEYGPTSAYGTFTAISDISPRVTNHSVTLSNLHGCSIYYYRVISADAAGNQATSTGSQFETSGCTGASSIENNAISTISTSTGGTVTLAGVGRSASISIPVGFSTSSADFQVKKISETEVINTTGYPLGLVAAVDQMYDFKAFVTATTTVSNFAANISVTLTYTDSDIVGLDESTLVIHRWDGDGWIALTNCVVNKASKTVTCDTSGFSVFGLFGVSAPVVTNTSSGGYTSGPTAVSGFSAYPSYTTVSATPTTIPTKPNSVKYKFTRDLYLGSSGADVKALQRFLNANGYIVAKSGAGSPGKETTTFGYATRAAVAQYQKVNKITPSVGRFGPLTRSVVNK